MLEGIFEWILHLNFYNFNVLFINILPVLGILIIFYDDLHEREIEWSVM